MNRFKSKKQRLGRYEMNKMSSSHFDNKLYILNSGSDGLVIGYCS